MSLTKQIYSQAEIWLYDDIPANTAYNSLFPEGMRDENGIIRGGMYKTASGVLRIPIVFVRFADDFQTGSVPGFWDTATVKPQWMKTFLDTIVPANGIYLNNNLSKYYDLFSGGDNNGNPGRFKVIGDVFLVSLDKTRSQFNGDAAVTLAVLDSLDNPSGSYKVDFRKYDNWKFMVNGLNYNHVYQPFNPRLGISADSILDCMAIFWREKSINYQITNVGGYMSLGQGLPTNVIKDNIKIKENSGISGFNARERNLESIMAIIAHEIGHYQFGINNHNIGSHYDGKTISPESNYYNSGNMHSFALMTSYGGHHFNAYERYRLGWLDPVIITTSQNSMHLNETHIGLDNNCILIPVRYDPAGIKEYFLLENYHTTNEDLNSNPFLVKNLFNHFFTKGIIVYHIEDENRNYATETLIDIECADGRWNWEVIEGGNTPFDRLDDKIEKVTPNEKNGQDERDNIITYSGGKFYRDYLALTPESVTDPTNLNQKGRRRYYSDDQLGDPEDFFNPGYNTIFTKYSNPSTRKGDSSFADIGFEVIEYQPQFNKYILNIAMNEQDVISLSPSSPQNIVISKSTGNHPLITIYFNGESDITSFNLYKKTTEEAGWQFLAGASDTVYEDESETYLLPGEIGLERAVSYRVTAVDIQNKESLPSLTAKTVVAGARLEKSINNENSDIKKCFRLGQNYPNPFNPSTMIEFEVEKKGFTQLKIFDIVGREIRILLSESIEPGVYKVEFNGGNLPSGFYICELSQGSRKIINKMLLLK